ncbi:MAG: hypothetical protein HYS23_15940 [Geobacter sp.]|nr:hypothetical protein [Geobacter sp.]
MTGNNRPLIVKSYIMATVVANLAIVTITLAKLVSSPEIVLLQDIRQSENRFEKLKAVIPAHGIVGYVSDCADKRKARLQLSQYALAPAIIVPSAVQPLVVGDLCDGGLSEQADLMVLLSDFGRGVVLFGRKTR